MTESESMTITPDPVETPICLLGAYERDNFGDVLFLHVTSGLLAPAPFVATAPFGARNDYHPEGIDVLPLGEATSRLRPRSVWMVGGEVGGTSMHDAFRMAADDAEYGGYSALPLSGRKEKLSAITGRSYYSAPYIPRMSARTDTERTRLIINSAGLSGLSGLRGLRRSETWGAVREASYVSVRDDASSAVLRRKGVRHTVAPDLVHSLRLIHADWLDRSEDEPYALLQVKESVIRSYGTRALAELIVSIPALKAYDLRLFIAGTARGHDSKGAYLEFVEHARELAPSRSIAVANAQSPMEKARLIASASLWLGTSLHGWIISSAFEVPRVGLELVKVQRYARTWQDPMPAGVKFGELPAAVESALHTSEIPGRADDMAQAALGSATVAREIASEPHSPHGSRPHGAAKVFPARKDSSLRAAGTDLIEELRERRRR